MTRVLIALFSLAFLLLSVHFVTAQGSGCCANLYLYPQEYCKSNMTTEDECCPDTSAAYRSGSQYWPETPAECMNYFWRTSCDVLDKCTTGCCYDESFGCQGATHDECLDSFNGRGAQKWDYGFGVTSPCYNADGIGAMPECENSGHPSSCADYNTRQNDCRNYQCMWCPSQNKCFSACDSCTAEPQDTNGDRICEQQVVIDCTAQTTESECTSSGACMWCTNGAGSCMKDCLNCAGNNNDAEPPYYVCDTGITQCNNGLDEDSDGRVDTADFCCKDIYDNLEDSKCACTEKGYCCTDYAQQCADAGGTAVSTTEFNRLSCSGTCCDTPCFQIPICQENMQIKDNQGYFPYGYQGKYCMCGSSKVDVTLTSVNTKYCCSGALIDQPCYTVIFYGNVTDANTGELVYPVTITMEEAYTYSFQNMDLSAGQFRQHVVPGVYTITVNANGYQPYLISLTIMIDLPFTIALVPVQRSCNLDWAPINLKAQVLKCQLGVFLTWDFNCTDKVYSWVVYRDGQSIFYTTDSYANNYVETYGDLSWDKSYNYYVEANLPTGKNKSNTVALMTGNAACEGKCFSDQEFCLADAQGRPAMRVKCSDDNMVIQLQDCTAVDPNGVCIGPDYDDKTYCSVPESCEETGIPDNTFGMYYDRAPCLIDRNGQPRYCYYDYSDTTVDSCQNCSAKMFCPDYRSSDACTTNNCRVTSGGQYYQCLWYQDVSNYQELGKGFCFAPRYSGGGYCSSCSSKDGLFANAHCSSTTCDLLGACYRNATSYSCVDCKKPPNELFSRSPTRCEVFVDKRSCIGSSGIISEVDQPFHINACTANNAPVKSGDSFLPSSDACGLGVCKWNDSTNLCFKDGNDDNKPDCSSFNIVCQKDALPPQTRVQSKPEKISRTSKGQLTFSISDYGLPVTQAKYSTYFCIDSSNRCCPDQLASKTLVLSGDGSIPSLVGVQNRMMYFRFFSVDDFNNTEAIKNTELIVDTKPPTIVVRYSLTNTSGSATQSDLVLRIDSDEPVSGLVDKLVNIETKKQDSSIKDSNINPPNSIVQVYPSLSDGWYLYSIQGKDSFGNQNTTEVKYVRVDRLKRIMNESPAGKRFLPTQAVTISLQTYGQYDCFYQQQSPTAGTKTRFSSASRVGTSNTYKYQTVLGTLSNGYYEYSVQCEESGQVWDSAILFFVVDGIAPTAQLMYQDYVGHYVNFDPNAWYQKVKIRIQCNDSNPLFQESPGPYGCNLTYYCFDASNTCDPNKKLLGDYGFVDLSTQTQSFFLRYYSIDYGGNKESMHSQLVKIDNSPPVIVVNNPTDQMAFSNPLVTLDGTWADNSATEILLTVALATGTGGNYTQIRGTGGQFSTQVRLGSGENTITVTAKDTGVNGGQNIGSPVILTVYYDTIGPEFSNVQILNHLNVRIDDRAIKAEYARNIRFLATIDDKYWTKDVAFARITVMCINQTMCSSYRNNFTMVKNQTKFSYVLDPLVSGILMTGKYFVNYYAQDPFGNSNRYNQTFTVGDTSTLTGNVRNHLGIRIDGTSGSAAEYGKTIMFMAKPSRFDITSSVDMLVRCTELGECGNYSKSFAMQRFNSTYNYTLDPVVGGVLLPGDYNVTYTSRDRWQKTRQLTLKFTVKDTSKLAGKIFNYIGGRVDDRSHKAEYGKAIIFNLSSSQPSTLTAVTIRLACANASQCDGYRQDLTMNRTGDSFFYEFMPVKDSGGIFLPDIGFYNALFIVRDQFNMFRTVLRNFTIVDTHPAELSITVETTTYNEKGLPKVGIGQSACLWYNIVISSEKPLNISSLKADIFRYTGTKPPALDFANLPVPRVSQNKDIWIYQLCVPYENPVYRYLRGNNTQFLVQGVDLHRLQVTEKSIISGRYFEIDTHGGDPPYLVTKMPAVYYARDTSLAVIGITKPPEPSLRVYMNLSGNVTQTVAAPTSQKFGEDVVFLAVDPGATLVEVYGNKESLFIAGRYVQFPGHNRTDGLYYRIATAAFSLSTQTTRITLQTQLEKKVAAQEKIGVFGNEKPTGWFSFAATLRTQGNHSLAVWAVDELGNIGLPAKRTIIYDSEGFRLNSYTPMDGSVLVARRPSINATMYDDSTRVNTSSIKMRLNNQTLNCSRGLRCTVSGKYVFIYYMPATNLADGNYFVTLEAEDIARNRNVFSWQFGVDSAVPVILSFEAFDARYYGNPYNRWYSSKSILPVGMLFQIEAGEIDGNVSLKESPTTQFVCHFGSYGTQMNCTAATTVPDGNYQLVVSARKYLGPGWSSYGRFIYPVTVDTARPNITFDPVNPSSKKIQNVSGDFSDKNMDKNDTITITGPQLAFSVEAAHDTKTFKAELTLSVTSDGSYQIFATATDKAGNANTASAYLTYDTVCNPVGIAALNTSYKNRTVLRRNVTYYSTNVGTLTWGIKVKGLAENGRLRVYTSYRTATNATTVEILQRTLNVQGNFATNITMGQPNGENYVRFLSTDLAGNNNTFIITIVSDTKAPISPSVDFARGNLPLAGIGSTGWPANAPVPARESCLSLLTEIERDSCLINLLLVGRDIIDVRTEVCPYISNYYMRVSCEAVA